MNMHDNYVDRRKINPSQKPDGSPDINDRVEIGPTPLAFQEWEKAGLVAPNLQNMRQYRLERLKAKIIERDLGGILLFDPLNIRYASDTTNMQLWNTHNPFRACFVSASGYMIVWDYKNNGLLTGYNPLVSENRSGASMFYFARGDKTAEAASDFAKEITDIMREHCGSSKRIAVDKIMMHGLRALEAEGLQVLEGEEVMEKTRAIKGPDEILAMRCAMHACEAAVAEMERQAAPNMTENEIWAVLHAENIKRGGEWIETRIMSSGPRTNPWFQECGPRIIQNNEIIALDTDLIGCYGMCADISRTFWIGDGEPDSETKRLYREAYEQIQANQQILGPGVAIKDIVFGGRLMPEEFIEQQYSCKMHGVGLCDEWPLIPYPETYQAGAVDYELEPGMMLCVEAYIGATGGKCGIKLEDQVMITEKGYENLTKYPFDEKLMAN